jgi:hypothetical protein
MVGVWIFDYEKMTHNLNKSEIWILKKVPTMKIGLEFGFRVLEI